MKEIQSIKNLEPFLEKISRSINKTYLKGIVSFIPDKNNFYVQFEKLGVSKIFFEVENHSEGFIAKRKKDSIAFSHFLFKDQVEKTLTDLISKFDDTEIK